MRSIATILGTVTTVAVMAQGPVALSLKQAMDMAATQSYAVQASALEAEKARSRVREITAIGLPQINATGSLNNYLEVPTQVVPNFSDTVYDRPRRSLRDGLAPSERA